MLDAIPECLELLAAEHGLSGPHLAALVGVLDLEPSGQLLEDLGDLVELSGECFRHVEGALLEGLPE